MTMKNMFKSEIDAQGKMDQAVRFVVEHQLKDRETWKLYTDVFSSRVDSADERWRGEYFGKQMRGACLAYVCTKDEELYEILHWACERLMDTQDELGRISTYQVENEFHGWDMWCRKYVLTGLQYFHHICKDEETKERIVEVCCKHLDYIVDKIGPGKVEITTTSSWWGCVNSCTILEPVMELYKMTGKEHYLEFARYIISTGGSSDCDFVDLALNSDLMPFEYPVIKAYEIMSFYEGLIAYYEVTGEKKYLDAAVTFFEKVSESDITIIGCAGCTHELFDNSAVKQTEYAENIMQETCVTVTWMRLLTRMYQLTKDVKYIDRLEIAGYNALYGSLNTELCEQFEMFSKKYCSPKVFDSYSPLYMNTRGRGIGGYLEFENGEYGGCCVAIGACGVALMPLTAVVEDADVIYLNHFFKGRAKVTDQQGKEVTLLCDSEYPTKDTCKVQIQCEGSCNLHLKIRKPAWCKVMKVDGQSVTAEGYFDWEATCTDGRTIELSWPMELQVHRLNERVAFTYGAMTLACDSNKSDRPLEAAVVVENHPSYQVVEPEEGELIRILCKVQDGELLLTDYQSCGKDWTKERNMITVWLNTK